MSELERFRAMAQKDEALRLEVLAATKGGGCGIPEVGRRHGFNFTLDDLTEYTKNSELSDFELELVAGGTCTGCGEPS